MARPPNQRLRLLIEYRTAADAGRDGLTDEEAAQAAGLTGGTSCWWKRCNELRDDYMIERPVDQATRKGTAGVERMVCAISTAGRAVLNAHRL